MTCIHLQCKFAQTRAKKLTCPEADSNTNEPIFQVATLRPQSAWDERGTGQRRPPRSVASVAGTKGRKRERERGRATGERASQRAKGKKTKKTLPLLSLSLSLSFPSSLATSVRFRRRPLQRKHGERVVGRARARKILEIPPIPTQ